MLGNASPSPPPPPRPPRAPAQAATPPDAFSRPYVDLMSPDWLTRAALAIAADLRERAGVGPQIELLDLATRHQLIQTHAGIIREVWRETFARTEPGGERSYPSDYATPRLQALDESAELARMRRVLGHTQTMLQLIAANAKDVDAPVERLAFIRGIAHGCDHFLAAEFGSVPPDTPETPR
jgi:hypothetical protein